MASITLHGSGPRLARWQLEGGATTASAEEATRETGSCCARTSMLNQRSESNHWCCEFLGGVRVQSVFIVPLKKWLVVSS